MNNENLHAEKKHKSKMFELLNDYLAKNKINLETKAIHFKSKSGDIIKPEDQLDGCYMDGNGNCVCQ